jgi:prophage antirepressor-like protein
MDILKAFKIADETNAINIAGTYEDPLFQANQIGKILGLTNIRVTIQSFDEDEKHVSTTYTLGGEQKVACLTELGLYRLLGMCKKPIARTFQKWVYNTIKEIRVKGRYELSQEIELEKQLLEHKVEVERHNTLISSFKDKRVIYLTKLKSLPNDCFIMKLGYTDGIDDRQRALTTSFGSSTFQHIFECNRNRELELWLKRHPEFAQRQYREDIVEGVKSSETYKVDRTSYDLLVKIIKRNIENYQGFNAEQYIENERIKLEMKKVQVQQDALVLLKQALNNNLGQHHEVVQLIKQVFIDSPSISQPTMQEPQDDKNPTIAQETDGTILSRTNTKNRRVQQYTHDTFELVQTYDGIMDAIRQHKEMSKSGVKQAATNNTLYNGYRWYFIDANDEIKSYQIPPTIETRHSSIPKHVAMLNREKTRIENVFVSLKQAAQAISSKRKTTVCDAIKTGALIKNTCYFSYFTDCEESLRNEYMSRHPLPSIAVSKGTCIHQIDINSNQVVKCFNSIADVMKNMSISRACIKRACSTGEAHNGYLWKYADNEVEK